MLRAYDLIEIVREHDPEADEELLAKAYVFSMKAHSEQRRANGDPYFSHPVEVAGILAKARLDYRCVVAGLLHDTLEDTDATREQIRSLFGEEVLRLVEGVTKLGKLPASDVRRNQIDNFRKLMLALADDLRVLLIKLADRMHNMRTIDCLPKPEKRARIARETLDVFAPLAERLGLRAWKEELEDRAFAELYPDVHKALGERAARAGGTAMERTREKIRKILADAGIEARVVGRLKSPHSFWRKMEVRGVPMDEIADLVGFRVLVNSPAECYAAIGAVHLRWKAVPGRFKDYVSTPKANGYQSLHTAILDDDGNPTEIQIRTDTMHDVAENGIAAHWAYKQCPMPEHALAENAEKKHRKTEGGDARKDPRHDGWGYGWVRHLVEEVDAPDADERDGRVEAKDLVRGIRKELHDDQVFCFTPDREIVAMPIGATPLDFAYAVHSELGHRCVGAMRNGTPITLNAKLATGDIVEILVDPEHEPEPGWESIVVTERARAAIRRRTGARKREALRGLGRQLLERNLPPRGVKLDPSTLAALAVEFGCIDADQLAERVGAGLISADDVAEAGVPNGSYRRFAHALGLWKRKRRALQVPGRLDGIAFRPAACCSPIVGDPIVGIRLPGKEGIQVHASSCGELSAHASHPERWVEMAWAKKGVLVRSSHLLVAILNRPGTLGRLCVAVGAQGFNITDIRFVHRRTDAIDVLLSLAPHEIDADPALLPAVLLATGDVASAKNIDPENARRLRGPPSGRGGDA
jgi:GTP pyrophosphokinase